MSTHRGPYRQSTQRNGVASPSRPIVQPERPLPRGNDRKLALSGLIGRTISDVAHREQQRSRLLDVLILAQSFLTVATGLGYIGAANGSVFLALDVAVLVVYLAAFVANRGFHRVSAAAYILVVGGAVATCAQTVALALAGDVLVASLVALLFVAVIFEAGLLFTPEVTLLIAFASAAFSAFALLLALTHVRAMDSHQEYLLLVYVLSLQLIAGLTSWLVAQFIYESTLEAQRAQDLQFAQARLDALTSQAGETQRQLNDSIGGMQVSINRALGGETGVRLQLSDQTLSPVAESLNLLFQRLEAVTHNDVMRARAMTSNLTGVDSNAPLEDVALAVGQMQSQVANRLSRVQRVLNQLTTVIGHSQEGLNNATESVKEAQRIIGLLGATSDSLLDGIHRQAASLDTIMRLLTTVLPREITQRDTQDGRSGGSLLGLGSDLGIVTPGLTGVFDVRAAQDAGSDDAKLAPLTIPLDIVRHDVEGQSEYGDAAGGGATSTNLRPIHSGSELSAELIQVWNTTVDADIQAKQMERAIGQLARDLGTELHQLRNADANIAWFRQALDIVRSNAEQVQQQTSAGNVLPIGDGTSDTSGTRFGAPSTPLTLMPPATETSGLLHFPQNSRPLTADSAHQSEGSLAELAPFAPHPADGGVDGPSAAPGSLRMSDLIDFNALPNDPA